MERTCPFCGKRFTPVYGAVTKVFCSQKCRDLSYAQYGPYNRASITFRCAKCGRLVITEGGSDARTRFCSLECEKKYWRHPPYDHEASRQNFHSIQDYESWERRTNA